MHTKGKRPISFTLPKNMEKRRRLQKRSAGGFKQRPGTTARAERSLARAVHVQGGEGGQLEKCSLVILVAALVIPEVHPNISETRPPPPQALNEDGLVAQDADPMSLLKPMFPGGKGGKLKNGPPLLCPVWVHCSIMLSYLDLQLPWQNQHLL